MAELPTQLVTAIGGNIVHFIMCQENLNQIDKDGQIILLQPKWDALKRHLEKL